jgi:hypothetical protein
MSITDEKIKIVRQVFERAMNGSLSLEELDSTWKISDRSSSDEASLYDDLRESLIHLPGFFFKSGIDFKIWEQQYEFGVMVCDYFLLNSLEELENWQDSRNEILKMAKDYKVETIKNAVSKYLGK